MYRQTRELGPLKARLQSFMDAQELVAYYLAHFTRRYRNLLAKPGFNIEPEASCLRQQIPVARPEGQA